MARTYRKKKSNWDFQKWNNYTWVESISKYGGIYLQEVSNPPQEEKKARNRFHRDGSGRSVPKWYVRLYHEKPLRQKTRQEIFKWIKKQDYDLIVPTYLHDAGWYYF